MSVSEQREHADRMWGFPQVSSKHNQEQIPRAAALQPPAKTPLFALGMTSTQALRLSVLSELDLPQAPPLWLHLLGDLPPAPRPCLPLRCPMTTQIIIKWVCTTHLTAHWAMQLADTLLMPSHRLPPAGQPIRTACSPTYIHHPHHGWPTQGTRS